MKPKTNEIKPHCMGMPFPERKKPLLLNGKPFNPNPPRSVFTKLADFLDSRPGEVFTTATLRENGAAKANTPYEFGQAKEYKAYVAKTPRELIFGTPSAIQEFKRLTEAGGGDED